MSMVSSIKVVGRQPSGNTKRMGIWGTADLPDGLRRAAIITSLNLAEQRKLPGDTMPKLHGTPIHRTARAVPLRVPLRVPLSFHKRGLMQQLFSSAKEVRG